MARLPDGRLGRFGWKAEFASLDDFVRAACANELGLSNPTRSQATSLARTDYKATGIDLTEAQCAMMADYLRSLPAPHKSVPTDPALAGQVRRGEEVFANIGCADCHTPDLGPIESFYSNLLLHDMGNDLASSTGYYGSIPPSPSPGDPILPPGPNEWRTPPLWGVADSAPYLHDGRADTLEEAIELHAGEAVDVTKRYTDLPTSDQQALVAFLKSLRAPNDRGTDTPARVATR